MVPRVISAVTQTLCSRFCLASFIQNYFKNLKMHFIDEYVSKLMPGGRRGCWPPGARDGCEPSDMGAGNWSQILGQSSTCSLSVTEPLSSLLHGSLQEVPRLFDNQLIPFLSFVLEFHIQNPGLPLSLHSSCLSFLLPPALRGWDCSRPHSSHAFVFWACSEKPGMVVHALTWQVGVWGEAVWGQPELQSKTLPQATRQKDQRG